METDQSDPNWWPAPPPQPPKIVSTPKLIAGTLLPIGIIALLLVAVLVKKHHPSAATQHTYAAFESCLKAQGGFTPSVSANSRLLRQVADACRNHLPPGTKVASASASASTGSASAEQAFQRCLQAVLGKQPSGGGTGGPGRFFGGGPSRDDFHNAMATCHAIEPANGGGQGSAGSGTAQV